MNEQPQNLTEYLKRFGENQKITGYGWETGMEIPCPFCAAPKFMVYRILDAEKAMAQNHICKECHRGAKAIFHYQEAGKQFEFVQTDGPDQPAWLNPKMRRVNAG